ncbi:MAG: 3-ketoacyl-ACP reductase [Caulobacteraceae bacterium]|nr:3-ketoacyl-ACP reductase [Caulobacteraceae bacterium]
MGRRVLVTAGAAGIGLAIADAFLAAGYRVHICDIDQNGLDQACAGRPGLTGSLADVGSATDVARLAQGIDSAMGGLDAIVNNAGIGGSRCPVDEITDEAWDAVMRVNVTGMFNIIRAFTPGLKTQGSGSIVNISTTSTRTGLPNRLPYVVSKAAVEGMTKTLARELGPFNIRCNSLLPGSIENERGRTLMQEKAQREGISYEQVLQARLGFISMRTRIEPREIGEAAVFLASDGARHITGQQISVCGNVEWEG